MILINTAIITPYIYFVTIKGIGQTTLWQILPDKNKKKIKGEINEVEKIGLLNDHTESDQTPVKRIQDDKLAETLTRIASVMENDKLFKEPELTLQLFADKLGIPTYLLSQAINEGLKKNFYDLVNGHRVEEAQRLLRDPNNSNYTILSVGFEAGFNSKTTFNTVFKKFTGLTPTEFRRKSKPQMASADRDTE
jgi:YesN/AraC family two-component response regulator